MENNGTGGVPWTRNEMGVTQAPGVSLVQLGAAVGAGPEPGAATRSAQSFYVPETGARNPKRVMHRKSQKKTSAFILKLFSMLHDPKLSHIIWWSRLDVNDHTTFAIVPGTQFSQCLSLYFKHSNVASFVRQLHMYGFHKVSDSALSVDSEYAKWEFRHTLGQFCRGGMDQLKRIKRRNNHKKKLDSGLEHDYASGGASAAAAGLANSIPGALPIMPSMPSTFDFLPTNGNTNNTLYQPTPGSQQQQQHVGFPHRHLSPVLQHGGPGPVGLGPTSLPAQYGVPVFQDNFFYTHPQRARYPSVLVDPRSSPEEAHFVPHSVQVPLSALPVSATMPVGMPIYEYPSSLNTSRSRSVPQQQQHLHQHLPPRSQPASFASPMVPLQFRPQPQPHPQSHLLGSLSSLGSQDSIFSSNKMSINSSFSSGSISGLAMGSTPTTTKLHSLGELLNADSHPAKEKPKELLHPRQSEPQPQPQPQSPSNIALKQ